jgi:hypothetical protein
MVWRKSLRRLDTLWESGLPAIWREAAAIQAMRFFRQKCASRFTTAAQPIATKVYSHRARRGFVEYSMVWQTRGQRAGPPQG